MVEGVEVFDAVEGGGAFQEEGDFERWITHHATAWCSGCRDIDEALVVPLAVGGELLFCGVVGVGEDGGESGLDVGGAEVWEGNGGGLEGATGAGGKVAALLGQESQVEMSVEPSLHGSLLFSVGDFDAHTVSAGVVFDDVDRDGGLAVGFFEEEVATGFCGVEQVFCECPAVLGHLFLVEREHFGGASFAVEECFAAAFFDVCRCAQRREVAIDGDVLREVLRQRIRFIDRRAIAGDDHAGLCCSEVTEQRISEIVAGGEASDEDYEQRQHYAQAAAFFVRWRWRRLGEGYRRIRHQRFLKSGGLAIW